MSKKKIDNSELIEKLSDYSHARLRTEMYFGSRTPHTQEILVYDENFKPVLKELAWVPALYTYFREILDNAMDEVIGHKKGNSIWVDYDVQNIVFTIEDNGRGIPIDFDNEHNMHKASMALSEARAGRNFREREEVAGANGVGASITNFCSEWFKLEIHRDNKKFTQEFKEGNHLVDDNLQIKKPKISKTGGKTTGTKITFKPSAHVFQTIPNLKNNLVLPEQFVRSRVIEVAICNPNTRVFYNGKKISVRNKPEQTLFKEDTFIPIEIRDGDFASKFFLLPNWHKDGEFVHSIVNNIPALNGGTHIDSFRKSFYKGLLGYLEKESRRRKLNPNSNDVQQGLLVYNITTMNAPNFDSQSKTRLINENAATYVRKFLENPEIYKPIVRRNKQWIEEIYKRCEDRTYKKDLSDIDKLSKRLAKGKVPKLMDANGKDRSKCVLLLTEGESAKLGMGAVRNPEIHAGLDLRGKVMNVNGMPTKDVILNKEIADIMNSVGLSMTAKADRKSLRYGQIWLATDADLDGANIAALLVNFFYSYWPELFDPEQEPFIHVFQTPYLIGKSGKDRRYWYAHNYHDYEPEKNKGYSITRAKGLGALEEEDWQHSLDKPELIPILDDGNIQETLDLIFNKIRADDRKGWMGI